MVRQVALRWKWAALLALLTAVVGIAVWFWLDTPLPKGLDPYARPAFDKWLVQDAKRAREFKSFQRFLAANGVGEVVPSWQLTRTDRTPLVGCTRPAFLLPPTHQWRNIVPVLRLLDKEVVPLVGPVEVVSAYRTLSFNGCVGGASKSRHLDFAAVDLIALSAI